jgi:hypothetical protein
MMIMTPDARTGKKGTVFNYSITKLPDYQFFRAMSIDAPHGAGVANALAKIDACLAPSKLICSWC